MIRRGALLLARFYLNLRRSSPREVPERCQAKRPRGPPKGLDRPGAMLGRGSPGRSPLAVQEFFSMGEARIPGSAAHVQAAVARDRPPQSLRAMQAKDNA